MFLRVLLGAAAFSCAAAALTWARSVRARRGILRRLESQMYDSGVDSQEAYSVVQLAKASYRKDLLSTYLFSSLAVLFGLLALTDDYRWLYLVGLIIPAGFIAGSWWRANQNELRLSQARYELEKRAEETLAQEQLAPRAWAARLAPDELPDFSGFEVGRVYQAGSGMMAGDFFDVYRVGPQRVAAVIGDVRGHGIESSITAFQAKYLLRVFLRQFRDPAQALEELNAQMSAADRGEEFISLVVLVFDTEAGTLRFASAGHPAAWLWHEREVQSLTATGPVLMLSKDSSYFSKEIPLLSGDMVLMYTDGLTEARNGDELFGQDRVAILLKRDPTVAPSVLCKNLLEAAQDFAQGPINDDVAILAIRRT